MGNNPDSGEQRIQVCYALSDPHGTYSKFAGASICSLLENTSSAVTVHLLTDQTLTGENKERFRELVARYGQEICFYDVPEQAAQIWKKAGEIYPKGLQSKRYSPANMYRLVIPDILPASVNKVIYLDADMIVNLDIAELWQEEPGESGLGAVAEMDIVSQYGRQAAVHERSAALFNTGKVNLETAFNSGLLVMRTDILRQWGNLLLEGVRLQAKMEGQLNYYDNDILIYYFAQSYTHLPWRYNVHVDWEIAYGPGELRPAIYHYLDRNFRLRDKDARYRLFLDFYRKTPWFNEQMLERACIVAEGHAILKAQARLGEVRRIFNACCHKKRVLVGLPQDEERLREDFALNDNEPYLRLSQGGDLRLPYPVTSYFYLFFWSDYANIKELMERAGYQEFEHFADGRKLMPEQTNDLLTNDETWMWNI